MGSPGALAPAGWNGGWGGQALPGAAAPWEAPGGFDPTRCQVLRLSEHRGCAKNPGVALEEVAHTPVPPRGPRGLRHSFPFCKQTSRPGWARAARPPRCPARMSLRNRRSESGGTRTAGGATGGKEKWLLIYSRTRKRWAVGQGAELRSPSSLFTLSHEEFPGKVWVWGGRPSLSDGDGGFLLGLRRGLPPQRSGRHLRR